MAEQWLSIVEYARATGISDMTIRRRIRTGRIKADLKEGKYFIPVEIDQNSGEMNRLSTSSHQASIQQSPRMPANKAMPHTSQPPAQQLVRNHPAAQRPVDRSMPVVRRVEESRNETMTQVSQTRVGPREEQWTADYSGQRIPHWNSLPDSMTRPLIEAGAASVEARALIEFCDRALDHARHTVNAIEGKYGARLESMNAQLANKAQEIQTLNQQIEDLQLLVQILERKKIG